MSQSEETTEEGRREDDHEPLHLLRQGAEGVSSHDLRDRIYLDSFFGRPCVVKERFGKRYRHPDLDKRITSRRLGAEARMLVRSKKFGIRTPAVYQIDLGRNLLVLEYVRGEQLKTVLLRDDYSAYSERSISLCREWGKQIATLHNSEIVHGDLTTSNIIVEEDSDRLCLIDFGLSVGTTKAEELGVDLYVLERSFLSTHPNADCLVGALLDEYFQHVNDPNEVLKRLDEVRMRGRKRSMVG